MDLQKLISLITALIGVGAIIYQLPKELTVELIAAITALVTVAFNIYKEFTTKK